MTIHVMLWVVMSDSATPQVALHGIERQALEIVRVEFEKYQETQVLTPSFVQLLKATHDMVMKRLKATTGIDTSRSPREILVELEQLANEVRMAIDLENEMEQLQ